MLEQNWSDCETSNRTQAFKKYWNNLPSEKRDLKKISLITDYGKNLIVTSADIPTPTNDSKEEKEKIINENENINNHNDNMIVEKLEKKCIINVRNVSKLKDVLEHLDGIETEVNIVID